ncbi:glutamine amidotransferase [Chondromyces apiculatus]|uniref:GMP synthase n=1 Tax=Chondromyces apiculatus DSM 436 TaxID=1192034 RepID=A0A017T9U1_9BACT|nr:glutamine amidotransferase [Chondromyces apiculatus]EYF05707.1 GMP synthase [Chondromyces apiculatus DSM 436]
MLFPLTETYTHQAPVLGGSSYHRAVSAIGKKIIIVTTGDPIPDMIEKRGSFAAMIQQAIGHLWTGDYAGFDARLEAFPHPREADAFIITGSASNVPNRDDWIVRTEAWLREVVAAGTPTFGICFGHQLLAHALGGECIRNPRGREIGTVTIHRRTEDPGHAGEILFAGLPQHFQANVTHIDTVGRLPPGAVSLARSDGDEHHAIRFTPTCYGVQFHPEIDAEIMLSYIRSRREILASEGFDVEALEGAVTTPEAGQRTLHNFLRHVVLGRSVETADQVVSAEN